jgi:hypothetical protein
VNGDARGKATCQGLQVTGGSWQDGNFDNVAIDARKSSLKQPGMRCSLIYRGTDESHVQP